MALRFTSIGCKERHFGLQPSLSPYSAARLHECREDGDKRQKPDGNQHETDEPQAVPQPMDEDVWDEKQ